MHYLARLLLLVAIAGGLTACGGESESEGFLPESDSQESTTILSIDTAKEQSNGYVSAFITDNLSREFSEVWVTVHEISMLSDSGSQVTLFQSPVGYPINLSQLVDVSQLLAQQSVAAGTYSLFDVSIGNQINMVDAQGNVIAATFGSPGVNFDIQVAGQLIVTPNQTSTLTLDFDLSRFIYDKTSGLVNPVINQLIDDNRVPTAQLNGVVTAVYSDRFEIASNNHTSLLTIEIAPGSVVYDERTQTSTSTSAALMVGDQVEVVGTYNADAAIVIAANVHIDKEAQGKTNDSLFSVEGSLVSYDGSTLILDVKQASFLPAANSITIAGVSNASFQTGSSSELLVGQRLQIKGLWDGQIFTANYVAIEGGLTSEERQSLQNNDGYIDIKGIISDVDLTQKQLMVLMNSADDGHFDVGESITVNTGSALIDSVLQHCLLHETDVEGTYIDVKGVLVNNTIVAKHIVSKGGCGGFKGVSYVDNSADERHNDVTEVDVSGYNSEGDNDFNELYGNDNHEANGLVMGITDTQLTLLVSASEGFKPTTSIINVDITHAWLEGASLSKLNLNLFVAIEGQWDGEILVARKVTL